MIYINDIYHTGRRCFMTTAKIFQTGRSQAVRLPKEFRFSCSEVVVRHLGNGLLLLPLEDSWDILDAAISEFEPEFKLQRNQPKSDLRPDIKDK